MKTRKKSGRFKGLRKSLLGRPKLKKLACTDKTNIILIILNNSKLEDLVVFKGFALSIIWFL